MTLIHLPSLKKGYHNYILLGTAFLKAAWRRHLVLIIIISCAISPILFCQDTGKLNFDDFGHYIDSFNLKDEELYKQHFPNEKAKEFLRQQIPLVELPNKQLEKTYYFRWWTFRKHLKRTPLGFVITEFLPPVGWAGKYNTINCPAAHHIYEGRWLRDPTFVRDYLHFWLTESGQGVRSYSFWIADAMLAFLRIHPDDFFLSNHYDLLAANYSRWEEERRDLGNDLFWQVDDRDGMEVSVSGHLLFARDSTSGMAATRPTINSYMYGDSRALAILAAHLGNRRAARRFRQKAAVLKKNVQRHLWHDSLSFFTVLPRKYSEDKKPVSVRELIGYTPWYFQLPDDDRKYAVAWQKILDTMGFAAPYGLTVCERSHPNFEISYEGHECQWNGPSWPFATTITLKGLANLLTSYKNRCVIHRKHYFELLLQYATSHIRHLPDGSSIPWIDENLNPFTGDWISRTRLESWENGSWSASKGGQERGKDYNHSGFCDLVISDLIGLKPAVKGQLVFQTLIPDDWSWFCLDKVPYQGKICTIIWDRNGDKYNLGAGLFIWIDGKAVFHSEKLDRSPIVVELDSDQPPRNEYLDLKR